MWYPQVPVRPANGHSNSCRSACPERGVDERVPCSGTLAEGNAGEIHRGAQEGFAHGFSVRRVVAGRAAIRRETNGAQQPPRSLSNQYQRLWTTTGFASINTRCRIDLLTRGCGCGILVFTQLSTLRSVMRGQSSRPTRSFAGKPRTAWCRIWDTKQIDDLGDRGRFVRRSAVGELVRWPWLRVVDSPCYRDRCALVLLLSRYFRNVDFG